MYIVHLLQEALFGVVVFHCGQRLCSQEEITPSRLPTVDSNFV